MKTTKVIIEKGEQIKGQWWRGENAGMNMEIRHMVSAAWGNCCRLQGMQRHGQQRKAKKIDGR